MGKLSLTDYVFKHFYDVNTIQNLKKKKWEGRLTEGEEREKKKLLEQETNSLIGQF